MAERSYYWEALTTGDASLAPYTSSTYHTLWKILFSMEDNEGVVQDYLNALVVAGVSGGVSVGTGAGLVAGGFYRNSASVSVTIPTPVTDPRIDRIVLQKLWLNQTIRIARLTGTENASPTAPALTQTDAVQWEVPLAQALITTAGVITVTDEREFARTPLAPAGAMVLLDSAVFSGGEANANFINIPQIYKHLFLTGQVLINTGVVTFSLNADNVGANYNRIILFGSGGAAGSSPSAGSLMTIDGDIEGADSDRSTQFDILIPNYANTTFFKNAIEDRSGIKDDIVNNWSLAKEGVIWLNTNAIDRIDLDVIAGGTFEAGTQFSLYGLR